MAFRLLAQPIIRSGLVSSRSAATVAASGSSTVIRTENEIYKDKIGTREIVGYGFNGVPNYADRLDYPLPAIRWKEETPEIKVFIRDAFWNLTK